MIFIYTAHIKRTAPFGADVHIRKYFSESNQPRPLFNADKPTYRLTPAGPDHASVAACAGMVDYYEDIYHHHFQSDSENLRRRLEKVFQLFGEHEEQLMEPLINYILSREDFRLIGTSSTNRTERAPTVAFHSYTKSSEAIYNSLIDAKVSCGHGNFYAHLLTEAVGLNAEDGVVRYLWFTTTQWMKLLEQLTFFSQ